MVEDPAPKVRWDHQNAAPRQSRFHRLAVGLIRRLPDPIVRIAANRYIAGETLEDALAVADTRWEQDQLHSTLDVLGEDVTRWDEVEEYNRAYDQLVDELGTRPHANISIKLSALGQELDEDDCFRRARDLIVRAGGQRSFVRFDMEDHTTVDSTLRIYRRCRAEGLDNCGVVLQSRLYRTRDDVAALAELQPNVRLCIGIYPEAPDIALQSKTEMKRHLLELLRVMWDNGQHVGIATHEEWVIRESLEIAQEMGKPLEEVEVQMLLGVPRLPLQRELVASGVTVRLYVPFGHSWRAYSMRRLENNPDMMKMVVANVVGGFFRRD